MPGHKSGLSLKKWYHKPMRVYFERSGGFAGIRTTVEIDTDTLSDDEADILRQQVSQADIGTLPKPGATPTRGADRFQYVVKVETDDGNVQTARARDGAIPPALQPLLDFLQKKARQK